MSAQPARPAPTTVPSPCATSATVFVLPPSTPRTRVMRRAATRGRQRSGRARRCARRAPACRSRRAGRSTASRVCEAERLVGVEVRSPTPGSRRARRRAGCRRRGRTRRRSRPRRGPGGARAPTRAAGAARTRRPAATGSSTPSRSSAATSPVPRFGSVRARHQSIASSRITTRLNAARTSSGQVPASAPPAWSPSMCVSTSVSTSPTVRPCSASAVAQQLRALRSGS